MPIDPQKGPPGPILVSPEQRERNVSALEAIEDDAAIARRAFEDHRVECPLCMREVRAEPLVPPELRGGVPVRDAVVFCRDGLALWQVHIGRAAIAAGAKLAIRMQGIPGAKA